MHQHILAVLGLAVAAAAEQAPFYGFLFNWDRPTVGGVKRDGDKFVPDPAFDTTGDGTVPDALALVGGVSRVYKAAGTSAIFLGTPFERRFRDIHTLSQQIQAREAHFENVGRILFNGDPDGTFM